MTTRRKTGGRRAGTPNKSTAEVKACLLQAFDELGGVASLIEFGRSNPAEFYKLWAKLLPTELKAEITGAGGGPVQLEIVEEIRVASDKTASENTPQDGQTPPGPT